MVAVEHGLHDGPDDHEPDQALIDAAVHRLISNYIDKTDQFINSKDVHLEEFYVKPEEFHTAKCQSDSAIISCMAALRIKRLATVDEEIAKQWFEDFLTRIKNSLKLTLPNYRFEYDIEKKEI